MRRSKVQMTTAALMAVLLLGGCGEAPYELTEQEENVIVNYSAHVVAKYNRYQKEGLAYVVPGTEDEADAEEMPTEDGTEASVPENGTPEGSTSAAGTDTEAAEVLQPATLSDLFGLPGLEIDYIGARLSDSYMEDTYYAMYPDEGKQYLVLGIDITNTAEVPVEIDYLTATSKFQVTVNNEVTSEAEITILTEDFSTFEGSVEPGETKETVLLFQVPVTITSVDDLELIVSAGDNYQIILENE